MKKHEYEFFDENYGKLYEATYFAKESRKDDSLLEIIQNELLTDKL